MPNKVLGPVSAGLVKKFVHDHQSQYLTKELLKRLMAENGLTASASRDVVRTVYDTLAKWVLTHDRTALPGLGYFGRRWREAGPARDLYRGTVTERPAGWQLYWKTGVATKARLKELSAEERERLAACK